MFMFAEQQSAGATVAELYRYVVGVDTHAKVHQYAIVEAGTGRVLEEAGFPTSGAGLARAASWIARRTGGDLEAVLISCEGTGSYGARLAKVLGEGGFRVVDAPRPKRDRGQDKDDTIDAIKAARRVLGKQADRLADVRAGELQEALKVLLAARDRMSRESTRSVNALTALLRGIDLGIDARRKLTTTQVRQVARWRSRRESPAAAIARTEAVRLATRIGHLHTELLANKRAAAPDRPSPRAGPAGQLRRRTGQRRHRAVRVVPPRPDPQRGRPGQARRRLPDQDRIRPVHRAPAQPRRRPTAQQGPALDRQNQDGTRPPHPGLRPTTHPTRTQQTTHPTLPQALHRPPTLPHPGQHTHRPAQRAERCSQPLDTT